MGVEHIFRAYDIRGVFNEELTVGLAAQVGLVFGTHVGAGKRVCLGRDTRTSSVALENAIASGLAAAGCHVTCVGMMPIPCANFTTLKGGYDYGIYITASHNPPQYNGIRFRHSDGTGFTVQNEDIKELYFRKQDWRPATWDGLGRIERADTEEVIRRYCDFLVENLRAERGLTIVIDPMHGAGAITARRTMEALGHTVHAVSEEIDPTFGGRDPHPKPGNLGLLEEKVKEVGADFGVAFDPDGDRVVFVDDKGRAAQVEVMGIILARDVIRETGGGTVLANIPCSMILEEVLDKAGGKVERTRVGDVFVCEAVKEKEAIFGMEISAHFFLPTYYVFDDPLLVSLRLARILAASASGKKLSEMIDEIPTYPTIEKGYKTPDDVKFKVVESIRDDFLKKGEKVDLTDGVKVTFDDGWALLRCSNTQPLIRLFAEASSKDRLDRLVKEFETIYMNKLKDLTS